MGGVRLRDCPSPYSLHPRPTRHPRRIFVFVISPVRVEVVIDRAQRVNGVSGLVSGLIFLSQIPKLLASESELVRASYDAGPRTDSFFELGHKTSHDLAECLMSSTTRVDVSFVTPVEGGTWRAFLVAGGGPVPMMTRPSELALL